MVRRITFQLQLPFAVSTSAQNASLLIRTLLHLSGDSHHFYATATADGESLMIRPPGDP